VGWVIDLAASDAERMPEPTSTLLLGVRLPRLAVAETTDPLPAVLAFLNGPGTSREPVPPPPEAG
jgi:hypothetical protein